MRAKGPEGLIPADDPRRLDEGLIYLDPDLAAAPSTHVLIVGVGAYPHTDELKPLTSTTVSARAVADWFLVDLVGAHDWHGFTNPDKPLGSLALLLSEKDVAPLERATYAGGPVPRAGYADAEAAFAAFLERCNSREDNLAILLICAHGSSKGGRSFFVLEDYGIKPHKPTFGMVDVEQIRLAFEAARPLDQLLMFDCCRLPGSGALPFEATIGEPPIGIVPLADDPGEDRRQVVLQSTCRGAAALGRENRTSLFVDALLCCLDGSARDFGAPNHPVRPGFLVSVLQSIFALHRLPREQLQLSQSRIVGDIPITYPARGRRVDLYVTFEDKTAWPGTEVAMRDTDGWTSTVTGRPDPLFERVEAPLRGTVTAEARRTGRPVLTAEAELLAAATFLEIDRPPTPAEVSERPRPAPPPPMRDIAGSLKSFAKSIGITRGLDRFGPAFDHLVRPSRSDDDDRFAPPTRAEPDRDEAELRVHLVSQPPIDNAAVLVLTRLDEIGDPIERTLDAHPDDDGLVLELPAPSVHRLELRLADGTTRERVERFAPREVKRIRFEAPVSPHEWLRGAHALGLPLPPPGPDDVDRLADVPPPVIEVMRPPASIAAALDPETTWVAVNGSSFDQFGGGQGRLSAHALTRANQPFADLAEKGAPLFARIVVGERVEFAALPHPAGENPRLDQHAWMPCLVVDRLAGRADGMTAVSFFDGRASPFDVSDWTALVGFLARRDFRTGGVMFAAIRDTAETVMRFKTLNPFAAAAGALTLVGIGGTAPDRLNSREHGDWLENLYRWFPGLPDGAVILARRRLVAARTRGDRARVRDLFLEAFDRGVPLYSLSIEWLAGGLERLAVEFPELGEKAKIARALADRVDQRRAFTVIRMPRPSDRKGDAS